jgi:hypothetical protein
MPNQSSTFVPGTVCPRAHAMHDWRAMLLLLLLSVPAGASQILFQQFPNNSTHNRTSVAQAIANVPAGAGLVYDESGHTNDIAIYNFGTEVYSGTVDVSSTLARIRAGDWMPTESDDGGFFNLRTNELPNIPRMGNNYYMEFVVWPYLDLTAGTYDTGQEAYGTMVYPGAMRLLIGLGGEVYFTGDHYGEDGPQQDAYLVNPISVPEPASLGLIGICAIAMSFRRARKMP